MNEETEQGTRDMRYGTRDSDNSLQLPVHGLQTRIQDSFAGYKFEDVIRMDEEEKEEERKRKEKIRRSKGEKTINDTVEEQSEKRIVKSSTKYKIEEGSFDYHVTETSPEGVQQYYFLKAPLGIMKSSEFPEPLTYDQWKERAIKHSKENRIVPASSKEIHILARAAYENKNGENKSVAQKIRQFLAKAMKNDGIGAYSRIVWQGKSACIMHSEGLPQEEWHRLPNTVRQQSIISFYRTLDINSITNVIFGDRSSSRVRNIYELIEKELYQGRTTTPHIETCVGKFPSIIEIPQTAISYRLQEEYFSTTTQLQPAFTIELANKTIDQDKFCTIGVVRR